MSAEPVIRNLRHEDGLALAALYSSPELAAQTGQLPDLGADFWLNFYTSRDPNAVQRVATVHGLAVGHIGILTSANPRIKHTASFGLAVHPAYQGKGIGKGLMAAMVDLCDNWLNITRIELGVFATNARAIALYERFGFEREGIARKAIFQNGAFVDNVMMARLRPV